MMRKIIGVACLATIFKQYGCNLSISELRELAGTDNQGTSLLVIIGT